MQVRRSDRPGATVPGRPRLVAGWELRLTPGGDLLLLREWGDGDLVIEECGASVAALLRAADGTRSAAEVLDAAGPLDDECLATLAAAGVLEDAAHDETGLDARALERYDRQLAYFGQGLPAGATRTGAQLRLRDARICVLGMGGLGSWAALSLATCGVGTIVGVDFDTVELSNLNRQVLYAEADIGAHKAHAAGRILRAYDSALRYVPVVARVASVADLRAIVSGADAVVAAADWPPHEIDRWVSEACLGESIPYIAMSQQPPLLRVGPLYVPGVTPCHACQEAGFREAYPDYDRLVATTSPFATTATFGPACAIVGALAASELVHWLAGLEPAFTLGRSALIDLRGGSVTTEPVAVSGVCSCQPFPTRAVPNMSVRRSMS
jgi:molybdopterin/thiamine biosynthesis adenylyltransferase